MFRSLHMKLVLILVLLVISVMAVVGTFMTSSITQYNIDSFQSQVSAVFTPEFIVMLEKNAQTDEPVLALRQVMETYSAPLGIDKDRIFYVLDGADGAYLAGSDDTFGAGMELTPNIITALGGSVGQDVQRLGDYFDVAVPVRDDSGSVAYIVGVLDTKAELESLTWNLFTIIIRAMLFGLVVAILLSFLLSKTITTPVERLTAQASRIAGGEFGTKAEVYSSDEIGILTQTFNEMADVLESTLREIGEERNKLDTLFRHMADGVIAFDGSGKLIQVNPAAQQMLDRPMEKDMQYSEIFPNIHVEEQDLQVEGQYVEVDYAAKQRFLKIFFAPIHAGDTGRGIMAVLHDVTEERKLDASRKEFVANVSHELRTPLTNITSYSETLLQMEDIDAATRRSFLTVISDEAERMTRIVKDLLTLTRLDYGRMEIKMDEMDLRREALQAVRAMQIEAEHNDLKLTEALPESLPPVYADRERIQQVVINLISNAIKYNRPGGAVQVTGGVRDDQVYIQVSDTGIGVPAEDLPKLFDRFYRVDKARSREKGGTGLGLAIAKEIVEQHKGTITFESEYGSGSVVTISLPRYTESGEADA